MYHYIFSGDTVTFKSCLCFDPSAPVDSRISQIADMNYARRDHSLIVTNGKLYAVGGFGDGYCNSIEEYDPQTNKWREVGKLATATLSCQQVRTDDNNDNFEDRNDRFEIEIEIGNSPLDRFFTSVLSGQNNYASNNFAFDLINARFRGLERNFVLGKYFPSPQLILDAGGLRLYEKYTMPVEPGDVYLGVAPNSEEETNFDVVLVIAPEVDYFDENLRKVGKIKDLPVQLMEKRDDKYIDFEIIEVKCVTTIK
ncbi:hypothetical protein WR25_02592 [Diploscapter pachys]|uniref:Uncharacterized protein n=1 Tax=Diploscapter pachys TaxID=2018661 RepID=A0A2A2LA39_9BILA|nr:hypothetical protein WR25_02592 [Diploscapter pachys]